ncbi:MAG: hypothetical protein ACTHWF_14690 [Brachybacterium sp.]
MTKTLPMSRFIQSYNQHLTEAERTGETLVLEQRAGRPTWVLETEDAARALESATGFLATALTAIARDSALIGRFPDALASALPWVTFLPDAEREEFAREATETLLASASLGRYTAFATLIEDWRATAEVWSDPDLARSLSAPIDEPLDTPVDAA